MEFAADSYLKALNFAAQAHGEQKTQLGLPYVVHLSAVAMELIRALRAEPGHNEELAITCALLHDVLEDTPVSANEVNREFGPQVCAGIQALSKNAALPKEEQMEDSLRRILAQPKEIHLVKLADRITNLAPAPPHWTAWKISEYRKEAQKIYDALHGSSPFLAARFQERLATYGTDRVPAKT